MLAFILCCILVSCFTNFNFVPLLVGGFLYYVFSNAKPSGYKKSAQARKTKNLIDQNSDFNDYVGLEELNPSTGFEFVSGVIDAGGSLMGDSSIFFGEN